MPVSAAYAADGCIAMVEILVRIALLLALAAALLGQPNSFWVRPQSYTVALLPTFGVQNRTVYVTNAASSASCTVAGGTTVVLCRDTGSAWVPAGDGSTAGSGDLTATAVIDVIAVPDGTCVLDTTAVTVTGAALGGRPTVGASFQPPEGISISVKVTGPNSVKLEVCNHSGASYNPASATYYFGVTP
jgi:hypothetical protein